MHISTRALLAPLLGLSIIQTAAPLGAQTARTFDPAQVLLANLREGSAAEPYLANLQASLRELDKDGNGLDPGDIARLDQKEVASLQADHDRRREEARIALVQSDADHDGRLSPGEFSDAIERENSGRTLIEAQFRKLDHNGDGLIRVEEVQYERLGSSKQEFERIDTNRDGGISLEELLAMVAASRRSKAPDPGQFQRRDRNGDGYLNLDEWVNLPGAASLDAPHLRDRRDRVRRIVSADPNRDGHLTAAELADLFRRGFAGVDRDGDGVISRDELDQANPRIELAARFAEASACAVPRPGETARAVAVTLGGGEQLSTVALDRQDLAISIVDLKIDPGAEPLYLLVSSIEPVIWRLSGAAERIERIAVFGHRRSASGDLIAAVSGLPQDKVHFAATSCLKVTDLSGDERFATAILAATDISAQARSFVGGVSKVTLPALVGTREDASPSAPIGFDPATWRDAIGFWPRGVATPAKDALVTRVAVQDYQILPGPMGIAQLVDQRVLRPTKNFSEYRIMRPMARFPGGMEGAKLVNFVLPAGMAMPAGNQGHGCIFNEAGQTIGMNANCPRTPRGPTLTVGRGGDLPGCLYDNRGSRVACFPKDGRPLVVTKSGKLTPAAKGIEAPAIVAVPPSVVAEYRRPIDIIPAGLNLRW